MRYVICKNLTSQQKISKKGERQIGFQPRAIYRLVPLLCTKKSEKNVKAVRYFFYANKRKHQSKQNGALVNFQFVLLCSVVGITDYFSTSEKNSKNVALLDIYLKLGRGQNHTNTYLVSYFTNFFIVEFFFFFHRNTD